MRVFIIFLAIALPLCSHAQIKAGFAAFDISPTEQEGLESCLGGYTPFARCGITDVHNEISVRAIALSSGRDKVIIASIDSIGVGDSIISEITSRVDNYSRGRIDPEQIVITATHTHNGPDLQGLWGGISDEYKERIIRSSTRTILRSYYKRKRATVHVSSAQADVENRRGWDEVSTELKALEFRSKRTGKSIATIVNMSAHPTILDPALAVYSSDYVGAMRSAIEEDLDTHAIFFNGIVGDAQTFGEGERTRETADKYGDDMAQRLIDASTSSQRVRGRLRTKYTAFTHPIANEPVLGAIAAGFLDVNLNEDLSVTTTVGVFEIGDDLSGIFFPGEALTRLGIPLLEQLSGYDKLFIGLAGASYGYFIPGDEFLIFPDRTTEEQFSLHPFIGDNISEATETLIDSPFIDLYPCFESGSTAN